MIDENFRRALIVSRSDPMTFFSFSEHPIALLFAVVIVITVLAVPYLSKKSVAAKMAGRNRE